MVERLSVKIGSHDLQFETGRIAKQAHGSVLVTCGETMVLSAVCVSDEARPGQDFFPLTVDFREKSFAAGKIPGNFFRREGRPTEREILVCRVTDRPIRPLFPEGFYNEIQVCQTVYSADNEHNPDVLSINAASAALHISKIPFEGPIGAVRIGRIDGQLVVNPLMTEMDASEMDLLMAGTREAICMVEGQANEASEDDVIEALELGHQAIVTVCDAIEDLRSRVGVEKMVVEVAQPDPAIVADVEALIVEPIKQALGMAEKHARQDAMTAVKADMKAKLLEKYGEEDYQDRYGVMRDVFSATEKRLMREQVIATNRRVDGRDLDVVRPITIEVGVLPRAHGSCLFTRGETQALVTTTLGTSRDEQKMDELVGESFKRFMLHYNFPSWSVGEVRRISGPGRREVGHGKLAERAVEGVLPLSEEDAFPYTIRIVSDITESNGSSSMASVCGASMSLMDAGVPIHKPVAGIAMGLIKEGDEERILSDILGVEDHLGDMDFKVTGTKDGITAFQMDVKLAGLPRELMARALEQAKRGRVHILEKMNECLTAPREEISPFAPRIYTLKIDVEKIRDVIGPGGKVIRGIQAETGAEIDIQDDGTINVAAVDKESAEAAIEMIESITADVEVGKVYDGTVTRLMNFGAFVSVLGGKEGLVHISELAPERVNTVEDVVQMGDPISVKVVEIDRMGRVNMSKVQADIELGRLDEAQVAEYERSKSSRDRGSRDRDRGGRDRGGRGGDRDRGRGGGGRDRDRGRGGGGRR